MSELNAKKLQEIKRQLDARAAELGADISRETGNKQDIIDSTPEVADSSDTSFLNNTLDLGTAAMARDTGELRAIEAARLRMDEGTYGMCVRCGKDIPLARLEVQPTAPRCAPCQSLVEKSGVSGI